MKGLRSVRIREPRHRRRPSLPHQARHPRCARRRLARLCPERRYTRARGGGGGARPRRRGARRRAHRARDFRRALRDVFGPPAVRRRGCRVGVVRVLRVFELSLRRGREVRQVALDRRVRRADRQVAGHERHQLRGDHHHVRGGEHVLPHRPHHLPRKRQSVRVLIRAFRIRFDVARVRSTERLAAHTRPSHRVFRGPFRVHGGGPLRHSLRRRAGLEHSGHRSGHVRKPRRLFRVIRRVRRVRCRGDERVEVFHERPGVQELARVGAEETRERRRASLGVQHVRAAQGRDGEA